MEISSKRQDINQTGRDFKLDETVYYFPEDEEVIINEIRNAKPIFYKYDKQLGESVYYYNIPASFDIETTSTYYEDEKVAFMYVWMFSINGKVIVGREWNEFLSLINDLHEFVSLTKRLIVYVHNLGFEFSFMQKLLEWHKVFCAKVREPIYAISTYGVEFRDSFILSGKKLAKVGDDLSKYKISKLVGDLDYDKIRGTKTPLTAKELQYCIHDCLVLDAYIQEKIENEGDITKIPLTKTGYVRKYLREKCYPGSHKKTNKDKEKYRKLMKRLRIDPDDYPMLKRAFMGGFTHANSLYVGTTITGRIDSYDFTSSYPAVMLSEYYPMSEATKYEDVSRETFENLLHDNLLIFDVRFNNIREKDDVFENYISRSKCDGANIIENNGRVVSADYIVTTITNIDFEIIKNYYDYDSIRIGTVLAYDKGYLPKPIIEGVCDFYKAKTELKGIEEETVNYNYKKEMLNSCYGCCVTDIVKPLITYTEANTWDIETLNIDEAIEKYNDSRQRFLYYPWGIFITAYARRNLFMGIKEFGADYIYSDTDSIKCINADCHSKFIEWYNMMIQYKVCKCLEFYEMDTNLAKPKTIKGVEKPIGVWDWETQDAQYSIFKTLGAKRYMYTQNNEIHITVAGLGKKQGAKFISIQNNPYEFFSDNMEVDGENTGKLLHTYIDCEMEGNVVDYLGEEVHFHEMTAQHLEKTTFTLSLSSQFKDFLDGKRHDWERSLAKWG